MFFCIDINWFYFEIFSSVDTLKARKEVVEASPGKLTFRSILKKGYIHFFIHRKIKTKWC